MRVCSALPRSVRLMAGFLGLIMASTTISIPIIAQENAVSEQDKAKPSDEDGLGPLPLSPIEKAQKDGTALPISLKELTKLTLQQNLDIAIQDTNEETKKQSLAQLYGSYDPTFSANLNHSPSNNPNRTSYDRSDSLSTESKSSSWDFTFKQPFKFGGSLQTTWNSSRSESNTSATLYNPSFSSSLKATFTQPLWRNLKIDQNRNQIKLANLDLRTSDSQFKQKVTDTISNIHTSYWDLVSAIRNYEIRRNSVKLAQINLRDNRKKVEVGTLAPIEVTDAEANVAAREVDLISAEEQILRAENTMRAYISNDRNSDIWKKVIVPTDLPDFKEYKVDADAAIATALNNRPELEQSKITLERYNLTSRLYQNNRKWEVNLTAVYGTSGLAGPQSCQKYSSTDPRAGECILIDGKTIPTTPLVLAGGIGTAYKTMFTQGFTNWQIGFNVNVPLRTRSLDAQIAQNGIDKRREQMTVRKTEQSIQVEVRNALQTLESNRKQVESAGVARRLAAERLSGEQKRVEAGLSQNYLVLDRQNQLASQEYNELQALIRYKQGIITLQKAMYTLLEANDFQIAKGSANRVPNLK
jgi:outer membrane protein